MAARPRLASRIAASSRGLEWPVTDHNPTPSAFRQSSAVRGQRAERGGEVVEALVLFDPPDAEQHHIVAADAGREADARRVG